MLPPPRAWPCGGWGGLGTHRRFGDSGSIGGPSIASGVHGICLRVLNLEGPGMSQWVRGEALALSSPPPTPSAWAPPWAASLPPSPYLVVVGTEVFEVSEADVAETDDNGDHQDDECEHGRRG